MAVAIQFYNNVAAESGPESSHNEIIYPIVALPELPISDISAGQLPSISRVSPGRQFSRQVLVPDSDYQRMSLSVGDG